MIRGGTRGWKAPGEIQGDKGKSMEDLWKFRRCKNTRISKETRGRLGVKAPEENQWDKRRAGGDERRPKGDKRRSIEETSRFLDVTMGRGG
jgi:hypothetical protein